MLQILQKCCYIATKSGHCYKNATKCYNVATTIFPRKSLISIGATKCYKCYIVFFGLEFCFFDGKCLILQLWDAERGGLLIINN